MNHLRKVNRFFNRSLFGLDVTRTYHASKQFLNRILKRRFSDIAVIPAPHPTQHILIRMDEQAIVAKTKDVVSAIGTLAFATLSVMGVVWWFMIDVKNNMSDLKTEVKYNMSDLKTEVKYNMSDLKTEVKNDISALKTEIQTQISALDVKISGVDIKVDATKAELKYDIACLRMDLADMNRNLVSVEKHVMAEVASVEKHVMAELASVKQDVNKLNTKMDVVVEALTTLKKA